MSSEKPTVCEKCGAFGDMEHGWIEGDCILPHRNHSRRLVDGTHICVHCQDRWLEWLPDIVHMEAELDEVLLAGSIPDDTAPHQHVKKIPASPSPLRLAAWALAHPGMLKFYTTDENGQNLEHIGMQGLPDIRHILANWSEAIYSELGWGDGAPRYVSASAALIQAQIGVVAALPDVDTFDAELRWVRNALRNAHGISDPTPIDRCLNVDCGGNVWPVSAKKPKCDRCGREYGTLDLVRLKAQRRKVAS